MRAEQHLPSVFLALPALHEHHRADRAGEVVIADVLGRDAAQDLERFDVAFEEGFLGLRRVNPVDDLAGVAKPEVALRLHPVAQQFGGESPWRVRRGRAARLLT